jgi:hypothetical protein
MVRERDTFYATLELIDPSRLDRAGLVGDWSARELIAHLGYWAGWATQAIHMAEQDRLAEFDDPDLDVDERNAIVARTAGQADLPTVRRREEASFQALRERTERVDPELLALRWGRESTLASLIDENGGEHYREHAAQLPAAER